MNTMTNSKRLAGTRPGKLRAVVFATALAGVAAGICAVPALAQDRVTTTRTVTTYDDGYYPSTTYYAPGPVYYDDSYAYPPAPAYTYVAPAPPPPAVGVGISVPFVHVGVGF